MIIVRSVSKPEHDFEGWRYHSDVLLKANLLLEKYGDSRGLLSDFGTECSLDDADSDQEIDRQAITMLILSEILSDSLEYIYDEYHPQSNSAAMVKAALLKGHCDAAEKCKRWVVEKFGHSAAEEMEDHALY